MKAFIFSHYFYTENSLNTSSDLWHEERNLSTHTCAASGESADTVRFAIKKKFIWLERDERCGLLGWLILEVAGIVGLLGNWFRVKLKAITKQFYNRIKIY